MLPTLKAEDMALSRGEPHEIEDVLDKTEDYQAPPREDDGEQREKAAPGEGDGGPIDVNLLEAQRQKSGLQSSERLVTDPS